MNYRPNHFPCSSVRPDRIPRTVEQIAFRVLSTDHIPSTSTWPEGSPLIHVNHPTRLVFRIWCLTHNPPGTFSQTTNWVLVPYQTTYRVMVPDLTTHRVLVPDQTTNWILVPDQTTYWVLVHDQTTYRALVPDQTFRRVLVPDLISY